MNKNLPLRIVQTGPTTYVVQQQVQRGWLWWRRVVWEMWRPLYSPITGASARIFASAEAAELFVLDQRELQQYPKVVKELSA